MTDPAADGTVTVVAALVLEAGRWLVARRPADDPLGPVWEFPGGKVCAGESLAAALERELAEELGIAARAGELVETIEHAYPHRRVRLHFLRATRVAGRPLGLDGQEVAWVPTARIPDLDFPPADARLLARLPELAAAWEDGG